MTIPMTESNKLAKLIDDFFEPWGSWKTAWWEMEVSDDVPFSADNLLREIRKRLAALAAVPPLVEGDQGLSSVACGLTPVSLPVCLDGDATPSEYAEIERLKAALRRVKHTLLIPAAEYVPAIPDAWDIIDGALK